MSMNLTSPWRCGVAAVVLLSLSACEPTFFGDAEPNLDDPFTEGELIAIQAPELTQVQSLMASDRWPGTVYAFAEAQDSASLWAFEDRGEAQGQLLLEGIAPEGWQDLALHRQSILLLAYQDERLMVHRYAEPQNSPPFDQSLPLMESWEIQVPGAQEQSCFALGTSRTGAEAVLLCRQPILSFYRFPTDGGALRVAEEDGPASPRMGSGVALDFSQSAGGDFGVMTAENFTLVGQLDNSQSWSNAFGSRSATIFYPEELLQPRSASFSFNTVLTFIAGPAEPEAQLFTIFNP